MRYSQQEALELFRTNEAVTASIAGYIRKKLTFEEQNFVLANVADSPNVTKYLTGICFATAWGEVWNPPATAAISSPQKSIEWFFLLLKRYSEKINTHITLRDRLHHAVLNGEWDLAIQILEFHNKEFGPTLWSLNWILLAIEETRGLTSKLEFLKRFDAPENPKIIHDLAQLCIFSSDQAMPEEVFEKIIQNSLPKGREARNFVELLFLERCSGTWRVSEMLDYFDFVPLIDRYELFLRLLCLGLGDRNEDDLRLRRTAVSIAEIIDDPHIKYIAEAANDSTQISKLGQSEKLIQAWDAFMASDYLESLKLTLEIIRQEPALLGANELYIKSLLYLGRKEDVVGNTPLAIFQTHLSNVYSKNDNADDSLNYLLIFGRRFRIFSLTYPLRALHAAHSSRFHEEYRLRRGSFALACHAPRNFEYGHSLSENRDYLARSANTYTKSESMRFFYELASGTLGNEITDCERIPRIRRLFFGGIAAARQNDFLHAVAYIKGFLRLQKDDSTNPLSPFAIEEARRTLIEIHRLNGNVVEMQVEVVNMFLHRPQSVRRLHIAKLLAASLANRDEASKHIEFPIIAHLASDEPHEVYLTLKRFLISTGVTKPSDLTQANGVRTNQLAALFLKVCSTEVLDSIDELDSVSKVESERLANLRWIVRHAPIFSRAAQNEILRLVQNAQLRDAMQKIEGAKVVVNVTALREAERDRFRDVYFRFAALREVAVSKTSEHITGILSAISTLDSTAERKLVVIDGATLALQQETLLKAFVAAFTEIRSAFLYSPHFGLEACLSGRIRHGIVIQHIRKPFMERRLAVLRESPEKLEIQNYWDTRLSSQYAGAAASIMDVLFSLTAKINAIASEVKDTWLHAQTEAKNPNGLFNFSFKSNDFERILTKHMEDVNTPELFLDRAFDILLERTRGSLAVVKSRINFVLRNRLRSAVDEAINSLPEFSSSLNLLAIKNDLAACRQETERVCDQMEAWFADTDATLMADTHIDLVVRTAIGMIEQLNPEARGKFQMSVDAPYRIAGRHFTSLVHIIFFMLDNAYWHSDVPKGEFAALIKVATPENSLKITVESNMTTAESANASKKKLDEKVSQLKHALDPDTVIKEGGSGYAKIFAAIHYGFSQDYPKVDVVCDAANRFAVSITCEMMGLSV